MQFYARIRRSLRNSFLAPLRMDPQGFVRINRERKGAGHARVDPTDPSEAVYSLVESDACALAKTLCRYIQTQSIQCDYVKIVTIKIRVWKSMLCGRSGVATLWRRQTGFTPKSKILLCYNLWGGGVVEKCERKGYM